MESEPTTSRRDFLLKSPIVGAAIATGAHPAKAEEVNRAQPDGPFRVGCLNVSTYSHLESLWAPLINPRATERETPYTGMRITHCWDIEPDKAKRFSETFGCEAVSEFDAMLGKVDGVISGGYYNHPWNHILHQPYLEAGLPNLINRPFANSRAKAKKMIEAARKHGAAILVPSSHEHTDAINRAKAWAAGKEILCYSATNSFDDYPTHGIHGVYLVCKSIVEVGNPIVSVGYRAASWHRPPGVMVFEHVDKNGRCFYGDLHQVSGSWGTIRIHTGDEYEGQGFPIHRGTGYPFDRTAIWAPTIWAYQKMALHGEMPQTLEQIDRKNNVFLAGWRSILEEGGAQVRLEDVPEEWESPVELPNHPGDTTVSLFRKRFG